MTDETRETLTRLIRELESQAYVANCCDSSNERVRAERLERQAAALRDVLTPRTCGTCRHANTEDTLEGWCYCAAPAPPTDVLFSGPDQTEKWAQKQANGKRFPFWSMAVPLDEGCKGHEPKEGES